MQSQVRACKDGFNCIICGQRISLLGNMKKHMRDIHLSSDGAYHCPPCDKDFKNRKGLRDHIRRRHDWEDVNYDDYAVKS